MRSSSGSPRTCPATRRRERLGLFKPIGLVVGVFCALFLAEPDLGTAITVVVMLGGVLVVSGAPACLLASAGALSVGLVLTAAWFEPYRRARLLSFLNPWTTTGRRYQTVQAMIGLGSGGIFGVGLGEGISKNFLPEAHTDMIFAIVGEELARRDDSADRRLCGVRLRGLRLALGCKDPFGKRLAAGITTLVCGQALINVAAVMGVAPLTGITLPFVSYGGSSLVVGLAGVGILLNIAGDHGRATRARCLIAAGGTAGHVLPAIAVGEALRDRGAAVTFAGSPDRVEARLVPGGRLRTRLLSDLGLPRGPASSRAVDLPRWWRGPREPPDPEAAAAGRRSRRRELRRRADGPCRRDDADPDGTNRADAHLGLANRLAAPFAERVFLSYELDGRGPPKYWSSGGRFPSARVRSPGRRRVSNWPPAGREDPRRVRPAHAGARSLNEFAVEAWGGAGTVVLHVSGGRDYDELRPRVGRADYHLLPTVEDSGQRSRPSISPCRDPAGRSGSWRRRVCRPCSCRTRMRQPTTRRRTLGTSSSAPGLSLYRRRG